MVHTTSWMRSPCHMALVSMSHRVIWAPPSVTEVAEEEGAKTEMLDSESSDVTDDMVDFEK